MIVDGTILPITSRDLLYTSHFHVPDVAYILQLSMNLISVSQLTSYVALLFLMSLRVVCRIVLQEHSLELAVAVAGCMFLIVYAFHVPPCPQLPHPFVLLQWDSLSGITA